jgi:hypothetical protein
MNDDDDDLYLVLSQINSGWKIPIPFMKGRKIGKPLELFSLSLAVSHYSKVVQTLYLT